MYRVYLTGQDNFGNRGCEALVRSTVALLKTHIDDVEVFVPSFDETRDAKQWPGHQDEGIIFVPAIKASFLYKVWGKLCGYFPFLLYLPWPPLAIPDDARKCIDKADLILSIGGDVYSLDYGFLSLFKFIGVAEYGKKRGIPAVLWGVSVGPFEKIPQLVSQVSKHLTGLDLITVRESVSKKYLESLGISKNVEHVADSAFLLEKEPLDKKPFWPTGDENNVLGFNLSPLVRDIRNNAVGGCMEAEVVEFLKKVVSEKGMSVLLMPHVSPLDGSVGNNDEIYLNKLLNMTGDMDGRVRVAPSMLNAIQSKYLLGQCRYFIGARTHATIGAISSGVPTLSISYSVKSKGINEDFFGSSKYVLPIEEMTCETLENGLDLLIEDEADIKRMIREGLDAAKEKARKGAIKLQGIIKSYQ